MTDTICDQVNQLGFAVMPQISNVSTIYSLGLPGNESFSSYPLDVYRTIPYDSNATIENIRKITDPIARELLQSPVFYQADLEVTTRCYKNKNPKLGLPHNLQPWNLQNQKRLGLSFGVIMKNITRMGFLPIQKNFPLGYVSMSSRKI